MGATPGHFDLVKDASLKWYDSLAIAKHVFRGDCVTSLLFQLYIVSVIAIPLGMFTTLAVQSCRADLWVKPRGMEVKRCNTIATSGRYMEVAKLISVNA